VLPILWSDNDVTLWPGESLTLTAHLATSGSGAPAPGAEAPVVEVSGWNFPTRSVPLAVESRTTASREMVH
jgi:exo-1,4-beta-D-glucosaminidase